MGIIILLTFILAPTYAIRFGLLGYPANILMVWVFLVWAVFLMYLSAKKQVGEFFVFIKDRPLIELLFISLFFLAGVISLIVGGVDRAKLGQFLVLFLQPISIFFIAAFAFNQNPKAKDYLLLASYYLLALAGLYAIVQYFSLLGLPPAYWGNSQEPKRALSFFVHPNFYALWSAPLLAFLIPDVFENLKSKILNLKSIAWLIGGAGLLLSLSRAGWLGLGAAIGVYALIAADKKIRRMIFGAVIVIVIVIISVPNLRWRLLLPFYGEKSASSRIELWQSGWQGIKQSPIFGLGLNGYQNRYHDLQTDASLPDHNFPHNILLNFWVETGLLGLMSFACLAALYIYRGFKNKSSILALGVALFLIAMITQGFIDNPYFKNDLALVFWIILVLPI